MTLNDSVSEVNVRYRIQGSGKTNVGIVFEFEGERNRKFEKRISEYIHSLVDTGYLDFPGRVQLEIRSHNSFPHSAGIASSASGFSALALCLVTLENEISGKTIPEEEFLRRCALLARLGSGSATRSLYGSYVTWGRSKVFGGSCDEFGQPLPVKVHPSFLHLHDSILIVSSGEKSVSSSQGHAMMNNHPYAVDRFQQADVNFGTLIRALETGDIQAFIDITEYEALNLHALMMSSNPGYILMKPNTIQIIEKVRAFRQSTGLFLCFTLDAGPNIHLLYPSEQRSPVLDFIKKELIRFCENDRWIDDRMGNGPVRLE
jgi:diphosphomevalonate decarboxylase